MTKRLLTPCLLSLSLLAGAPESLVAQTGPSKPTQNKTAQNKTAQSAATKQAPKPRPQESDVILFAVSKNGAESMFDPIAVITGRRVSKPPTGEEDAGVLAKFAGRYYRSGQKYSVLFGGGKSGSATVKEWLGKENECNRSMAGVELTTPARIDGKVMGLATNSASLGRKASSRRQPTAEERESVLKIAQRIYRQRGVPAALFPNMRTINLTAVDLDEDGKWEMIGSYLIKKKGSKVAHLLFLIAEIKAAAYTASLARYDRINEADLPAGASLDDLEDYVLAEILVDHLDIDRDGRSEVIAMDRSFEGVTYRIYKKQRSLWQKSYELYSYKCAY
ncbi:MAG TPA: hypothetical protein VJQ56_14190 [Blastocatellia bacterium]|nr:hypothetical protein [Blastocatellia bacterium]